MGIVRSQTITEGLSRYGRGTLFARPFVPSFAARVETGWRSTPVGLRQTKANTRRTRSSQQEFSERCGRGPPPALLRCLRIVFVVASRLPITLTL
jgi:hypothetical protein